MNKKDAIRAMLDGEKVKIALGRDGEFFWYDGRGVCSSLVGSVPLDLLPLSGWEIYEEFTYPMWFKDKTCEIIVRFDSLDFGEIIRADDTVSSCKVGGISYFTEHTNSDAWEQIPEPKTVTIEKWLCVSDNAPEAHFVWEGSANYISYHIGTNRTRKIKLIDSYEVTL